jgi:glycosyltransferase involved in cell wall biosynthesis
MNILWINKITDKDFWKTTQLELSNALRGRGHNVTLVMAKSIGEKKSIDNDTLYFPTPAHSLLSGVIFGLIVSFYSPLIIRKKKIDIIIIDGTSVLLPFAFTLRIFDVPLVVDVRDLPEYKKRSILFDISLYLSKYLTDGLTTITPELKEILRTKYRLINKKIGIWPTGVSKEKFIEPYANNNVHNNRDPKSFVLMHHGAYRSPRGVENLIKSMGELDDSFKKIIKLRIVGVFIEDQIELIHLCEEVNVKDQVEIIPQVEYIKIPSYILSSDVGVIPLPPNKKCWQVSVPLKTLEYLAMGKPIIATNIPFHQNIFEKGKCGVLIDNNSPKALSDAITYLYQNRTELDSMGKTGREIVKNHYTWDNSAFEAEKFLKTILADFGK